MLKARKKLATLAVASALSGGALMVSAPVQALNVSQNNLGEVLLFPYYTVKNGFDTVFTVTNTTNQTAVFKIRFREALNSREVRDFNVVLSPYDHWAGAVTASGEGAAVRTFDKTCTSPNKPAWTGVDVNGDGTPDGYEVAFTNTLFSGVYADGATEALSRVQEGYFEVILMGVSTRSTSASSNVVEYNAKHVAGTPRDCAAVDAAFLDIPTYFSAFTEPENILKGHVTYIDTATGKSVDAEPTAIENFSSSTIIYAASDVDPDLGDGDAAGTVYALNSGNTVTGPYIGGSQNGVSMALMSTAVINEFATGSGASTSWVVTFPTKHHYTDAYVVPTGTITTLPATTDFPPFSNRFVTDTDGTGADATGKSCDTIGMGMFNREEATQVVVDNTNFSPAPPAGGTVDLCYEANVVNFNSSSVFGSGTNRLGVDTTSVGTAGWAALRFTSTNANSVGLQGFVGLPTIGFAAIMRDAGSASINYGSNAAHAYISGAPVGSP